MGAMQHAGFPEWHVTRFASALLLAATLLVGRAAASSNDERSLRQFGIETWTVERGLAGNWVTDIAQTSDGYLWVATSGGLSRFDGRRFNNWTAADTQDMPSNSVQALALGPDGRLWLALEHGGVRVLDKGHMNAVPALEELATLTLRSLALTADGNVWVGTTAGLYRATAQGVARVPIETNGGFAEVVRLRTTDEGALWVRTRTHGLWRVRDAVAQPVQDAPDCEGTDIAIRPDGGMVTACVNGLWERDANNSTWSKLSDEPRTKRITIDAAGTLWSGSESGIERFVAGRAQSLAPQVGTDDYRVRALFADHRGTIWVGTFSRGLSRLHAGPVRSIGAPEGLAIDATTGVLGAADGTVWIGASRHGLLQWHVTRGLLRQVGLAQGLPSDRVWALAEDTNNPGKLFLGTAVGAFVFDPSTTSFAPIDLPGLGADHTVNFLAVDATDTGAVWIGTDKSGLYRWSNARAVRVENSQRLGRVRQLWRESDGSRVFAAQEGLFLLHGDGLKLWQQQFSAFRGVRNLLRTDADTVWIASDSHGITRWSRGKALTYGSKQGLPVTPVFNLQADDAGRIWISTNEGLLVFAMEDFERWSRGLLDRVPMARLGPRDGLRDKECNGWGQPTYWRRPDGDIVYPTTSGIAVVTPARLPLSSLNPTSLRIDAAWSGRQPLDVYAPVQLAPHQRSLRVRFSAPVADAPEALSFRYRLLGADNEWVAADSNAEAAYAYLAPGHYTFQVQARLPGQDWVAASTTLPVDVQPRLVESVLFRWLLVGALFAIVAGLLLWRWKLMRRHAAALLAEREFLHNVIDTCPEPIFVQDRQRAALLTNRAADRLGGKLFGAAGAEPPGDAVRALHTEVLATHTEQAMAECRIDIDGVPRWYRVVARPLVDASGEVERVIGSAVDITSYTQVIADLRARDRELEAHRLAAQSLAHKLLRAQEDERRRLGRELHDDITQRIVGLAMLSRSASRGRSAPTHEALRQVCEDIGAELERLADSAQAMSRELHPALLDRVGLADALKAECATFSKRSGTIVLFSSHCVPETVSEAVGIALYRIAQEALRNAVQHGAAGTTSVTLVGGEANLTLEVQDDGAGFDLSNAPARAGLGLASMAERAQLVGADFHLSSVPGQGTLLRIVVPLPRTP